MGLEELGVAVRYLRELYEYDMYVWYFEHFTMGRVSFNMYHDAKNGQQFYKI